MITKAMLADPSKIPVAEFYEKCYRPKRNPADNAASKHQHKYALNHLRRALEREPTLADFNDDTLTTLTAHLAGKGLSPVTVNGTIKRICAVWRFAIKRGLDADWPDPTKLPEPRRVPQCWSREELARLLRSCAKQPGKVAGVRASDWWLALHFVVLDTAERIGAVLQVEWSHLRDDGATLFVPAEIRKARDGDRSFPLGRDTQELLHRVRRQSSFDLIFHWDLYGSYIYHHYERILARAELPFGSRDKFHKLRRTVATLMEAGGHDASRILGHSSRAVTERHYIDPTKVNRVAPCHVVKRPNRKGGER